MAFTTITDNELINMGVTGLPDTPELSTEEMQAQFDEYPQFLKDKFKTHIEEEEANTAAANIGAEIPEELDNVSTEKIQPILNELATRVKNQKDWQDAADENFSPTELNTGAFHADATNVTVPTMLITDVSGNAASTEFVDNKMQAIGAGDMAKSTYDPNNRGMVETAYKVGDSYVESITESEASYPVPAANDKMKVIIGKIKKYLNDLKTTVATHLADGMMSKEDKIKLDDIKENSQPNYYGECTTASATAAKEVTISDVTDFELKKGVTIAVRFIYENTAQNPTLNVNNTGAKQICTKDGNVTDSNISIGGDAHRFMVYMYNGTSWMFLGDVIDNNVNQTSYNLVQNKEVGNAVASALSKIAEIDLSSTATRPHASGKYLIYGSVSNPFFGKTKAAIAYGDEFNYGTGGNITNIDVSTELTALNSALTIQNLTSSLSLLTNNVSDVSHSLVKYGKIVQLQAELTVTAEYVNSNFGIMNLPSGCYPSKNLIITIPTKSSLNATVTILTNGQVQLYTSENLKNWIIRFVITFLTN